MDGKTSFVEVTPDNIAEHPQVICYINPKHEHFHLKVDWLEQRHAEGLKVKLLYLEGEKKPVGFVEYVPGEHCWRAVSAEGYMFIHCLWTYGRKYQHKGLGGLLLEEVERDAKGMRGVAALASDGPFMANKSLFVKNGYAVAAESGKDQLVVKPFTSGPPPRFNDWEAELARHQGWCMIYSRQCPWVARFTEEIRPVIQEHNLKVRIAELETPAQAQKAPSLYGVFNLVRDGRLLADRYISRTRFQNILGKELS